MTQEKARLLGQRCLDWAHLLLIIQGAWLVADFHPDATFLEIFLGKGWSNLVLRWIALVQALGLTLQHLERRELSFRPIALVSFNASLSLALRGGRFLFSGQGLAVPEQLSLTAVLVSVALASWFNRVAREEPTRTSH